jgi:hypothetical protein
MIFDENKYVVAAMILEAIVILLPVIYGLNAYSWDFGELAAPNYDIPRIDFSLGEVSAFRSDDMVYFNMSISNDGELLLHIEAFNASIAHKNMMIGEACLKSPVDIESEAEGSIIMVFEVLSLEALIDLDENELLDLTGDLGLEVQGIGVEVSMGTTIPVKVLVEAVEAGSYA